MHKAAALSLWCTWTGRCYCAPTHSSLTPVLVASTSLAASLRCWFTPEAAVRPPWRTSTERCSCLASTCHQLTDSCARCLNLPCRLTSLLVHARGGVTSTVVHLDWALLLRTYRKAKAAGTLPPSTAMPTSSTPQDQPHTNHISSVPYTRGTGGTCNQDEGPKTPEQAQPPQQPASGVYAVSFVSPREQEHYGNISEASNKGVLTSPKVLLAVRGTAGIVTAVPADAVPRVVTNGGGGSASGSGRASGSGAGGAADAAGLEGRLPLRLYHVRPVLAKTCCDSSGREMVYKATLHMQQDVAIRHAFSR